jgi:hypothetical protein
MTEDGICSISPPRHPLGAPAPKLPLLRHETSLEAAAWLQQSLTTFAERVNSFLPGRFSGYARLYHPFEFGGLIPAAPGTWQELATRYGRELRDAATAETFAYNGVPDAQAQVGTLPPAVIEVLLEHLRLATATPEQCYYAVWTGFGSSVVPSDLQPQLRLLHREYHLFSGPLAAARTTYDAGPFARQSANLWWPADQAWCVASEIDHAWSYVGGAAPLIAGILADRRLDAMATGTEARW